MAQGQQPIIIEERRNGLAMAIVALATLAIVALLVVLAVMGASYLFVNNDTNNPPAENTQPTQAPMPTNDPLLPLPGSMQLSTSFTAG
jgi:hypothetical protein